MVFHVNLFGIPTLFWSTITLGWLHDIYTEVLVKRDWVTLVT